MDIYLFAFCLIPLIAVIGAMIGAGMILAKERRVRDRRHHSNLRCSHFNVFGPFNGTLLELDEAMHSQTEHRSRSI